MTIAEYIMKCLNNGHLRSDRTAFVKGMGEIWRFVPDRKYGPGVLVNTITGNLLSVAELSDREIDFSFNDWEVMHNYS
jgi:hypothetical protein